MTRAEQHKMITELRDYEARMSRDEEDAFGMLVRRDKDDEDLDRVAERTLMNLYTRYVEQRRGRR
jgi:hypothetical protein